MLGHPVSLLYGWMQAPVTCGAPHTQPSLVKFVHRCLGTWYATLINIIMIVPGNLSLPFFELSRTPDHFSSKIYYP